ncbi:MAG: hypothetical protein KAK00_00190 [Nanoarchaeota archaeon]|nr:hypothetical protein [Nanoarchaeota archaeon]
MKIENHLKKAERFERTLSKLDLGEDYETMIEDYLLVASHLINAALHKLGKLKIEKDIKHNQMYGFLCHEAISELGEDVKNSINNLEQLRPSHVYGKGENGNTAKKAKEYFEKIKKITLPILEKKDERES